MSWDAHVARSWVLKCTWSLGVWDCEGRVKGASGLVLEQDLELVARAMEGAPWR